MDETAREHLGIVAGGGRLPQLLISECQSQKRPYTVVALEGHADSLEEAPADQIRIGQAGTCFQTFHDNGVLSVVMAGKVRRPNLFELRPDWRTVKFLARTGLKAFRNAASVGDDKLLRLVIAEIESEGFKVIGVDDVLSDSIARLGPVGRLTPSAKDQKSIEAGLHAARALGRADIGQAVVVQNGVVIAREGLAGTDALIQSIEVDQHSADKPILVKSSKPQQDRRADLPVIGPETVAACVSNGFGGLAVEAGGALLIDPSIISELADEGGIFVVGVGDETKNQDGDSS